ncbi:MAG TPA: metalloregulator ArsR/SmtB family transcription factor [Povalibacter sp.]|nr:metalloregulator ArsR/SmtB family transcription factor [Povalibacter sp.]
MVAAFLPAVAALKAAAEPTRLRLLALLSRGELTVGEICEIVGQSQPRISRHLKVLSDAGLLDRFREQNWVYYRTPSVDPGRRTVSQILELVNERDDVLQRDRRRLQTVVAERARLASVVAVPTALPAEVDKILLNELTDAPIGALLDVGTGSGHLLGLLAAQATRAVGVDISRDALRLARSNVHGAGLSHCELQRGDMYDLPFSTPTFDTATVDRILAQAERPVAALAEIARTLRAGARLVVVEDFDRLSERTVDARPTRNPIAMLRAWFAQAGLACDRVHPIDTEHGLLVVAVARRISAASAAA